MHEGEIIALVGHNGSGKSTLVKILAGVYTADSGDITTADDEVELHFIHQDLGLIHELSAVENLWLRPQAGRHGLAPFRSRADRARARELLGRFAVDLDVDAPLSTATPAQRAIVAIARALDGWRHDRNILVLDEPTESLHASEVATLFTAVRSVAASGAGIVFISHRLDEVLDLADRVVVLREGKLVADTPAAELEHDRLLTLVTGASTEVGEHTGAARLGAAPVLEVKGLHGGAVGELSLRVVPGEVVGVAGVLGSGREHVAPLLFGSLPSEAEVFRVHGEPSVSPSPAKSLARGVAYVPADRAKFGAIPLFTARENMTLPELRSLRTRHGTVHEGRERHEAERLVADFDVRPSNAEQLFGQFSGGNQQKIVFAKWLRDRPRLLIMEEPTQGVDMGAKQSIYATVRRAAAEGTAVVVCSSDAKELSKICDRVVVLRDGHVAAELPRDELSEARIIAEGYGLTEWALHETTTAPTTRATTPDPLETEHA
ncbi:sugar ABC transporter ATP-binding protein [Pseudoclavibacter endophyticus]|nr:sugar ABC transporter ATP-binding protein [Pseudoclavibacter endophyticus]